MKPDRRVHVYLCFVGLQTRIVPATSIVQAKRKVRAEYYARGYRLVDSEIGCRRARPDDAGWLADQLQPKDRDRVLASLAE